MCSLLKKEQSHNTFKTINMFSSITSVGSVDEGVGIALGYRAHVLPSQDFEVSIHSPSASPGVLDVPEGLPVVYSITSSQHCIVNIIRTSTAISGGVHSSSIVLETRDDFESN